LEENSHSSKDEIYINRVEGDVIGVGVSGSGNIIGKNITVYQQSIDSARIPYNIIEVNSSNTMQSLQQLATYINLKLYEKNQELIPFIPPNEYEKWKETDKLLLYGRSGSGKSRTMFEIIKDKIPKFDHVYVISPHNLAESVHDETSISNLVSKMGENDIIIWDNFPDGFLQGEINVDHGLEILMAVTRVKHLIVSINPVKLELYKKHLWKLYEHLTFHEVIFNLQSLQNVVKSYGENISRFNAIYKESIEKHLHDISEILVKKEPTPLAVLHYYEKILNSIESNELKTINNNNFAIQLAKDPAMQNSCMS
jgi:hypothetical protein